MEAKEHPTAIESIILLDNNDIAVSGGPIGFEIVIYRNRLTEKHEASSQYDIVDSISTNGNTV